MIRWFYEFVIRGQQQYLTFKSVSKLLPFLYVDSNICIKFCVYCRKIVYTYIYTFSMNILTYYAFENGATVE